MRFRLKSTVFAGLLALTPSAFAAADEFQCDIDISHNVRVSSEIVEVTEGEAPLFTINQAGDLQVRGEAVALETEQRELARAYAGEVSALVPQVIELVSRALELAGGSVQVAFDEAFGEGSQSGTKMNEVIEQARLKFEARAKPEPGVYVLSANDDELGDELGDEIDALVGEAMGELMGELGRAMTSGEGSFIESMEAFGERMETLGEEIEQSSEVVADFGEEACNSMRRVAALESEMQAAIPAFRGVGISQR